MFAVTVIFDVREGEMEKFLPMMRRQAENSVTLEPDCKWFDVWTDPQQPNQVFLYELYTDAAAFARHLASDHFKAFAHHSSALIHDRRIVTWANQEAHHHE